MHVCSILRDGRISFLVMLLYLYGVVEFSFLLICPDFRFRKNLEDA
jgi:hypothetical protein